MCLNFMFGAVDLFFNREKMVFLRKRKRESGMSLLYMIFNKIVELILSILLGKFMEISYLNWLTGDLAQILI